MVITVEPGIYIPSGSPCDKKWWGIAVRIEDDVRVGKQAPELLSYLAPRKAEDVEKRWPLRKARSITSYYLRYPPLKKDFNAEGAGSGSGTVPGNFSGWPGEGCGSSGTCSGYSSGLVSG